MTLCLPDRVTVQGLRYEGLGRCDTARQAKGHPQCSKVKGSITILSFLHLSGIKSGENGIFYVEIER